MRADHLRCRTLGHSWDPGVPPPPWAGEYGFGEPLYLRCAVCGAYRIDVVSVADGQLLYRYYRHPEGYSLPRDETPSRAEFRRRFVAQGLHQPRRLRAVR